MRLFLIALGPLAIFLGAACSSEAKEEHPDHAAFVASFAERYCALATQCCLQLGTESDAATCRSSVASVVGSSAASLSSGRARFDAQAAADCLAQLDAFMASCSPPSERPAVCDRVVRGKLAAGAGCALDSDCEPAAGTTTFCKAQDLSSQGVCVQQPPPVAGMGCDTTTCEADPTLYCEHASGTCAARPGDGQVCSLEVPCAPGTSCVGTANGLSVCATDRPIGADCSLGQPCAAGSYCAAGSCAAQKGSGEPCSSTDSRECSSACDGSACEPVEPANVACFPGG
jgi:hypothetical protein